MSDDGYRGVKMQQAWQNSNSIPGATLAERVQNSLTRDYSMIDARTAVRAEVEQLGGEAMARRYWVLVGKCLSGVEADEVAKGAFVQEIRALEKRPEPASATGAAAVS